MLDESRLQDETRSDVSSPQSHLLLQSQTPNQDTLKIVQSSHFTKFKSYLLFAFFLVLSHTRDLCNKLYEYDHTSMSLVLLFLDYIGP